MDFFGFMLVVLSFLIFFVVNIYKNIFKNKLYIYSGWYDGGIMFIIFIFLNCLGIMMF